MQSVAKKVPRLSPESHYSLDRGPDPCTSLHLNLFLTGGSGCALLSAGPTAHRGHRLDFWLIPNFLYFAAAAAAAAAMMGQPGLAAAAANPFLAAAAASPFGMLGAAPRFS